MKQTSSLTESMAEWQPCRVPVLWFTLIFFRRIAGGCLPRRADQ